jgi:palmitoyl-protein thioesterase
MLLKYLFLFFAIPLNWNISFYRIQAYPVREIITETSTITTTFSTTLGKDIPIVVLHGIASSAPNMEVLSEWLENTFDRDVFNIEIGNGQKSSLFMPLQEQLNILCDTIYNIDELQDGFDFIGMSQGGLLARGYLENCNGYPVRNLINLASPNGGVIEDTTLNLYSDFYQEHLSLSGYWRDPLKLEEYLNKCSYLPFLNNERIHQLSTQYKERILSLKNYILIWSPFDDVINPPESAKFSFFDDEYNIIPLRETLLYKEDVLGLRSLDESNRFHIYETNCTHVQHRDPVCFQQLYDILDKYF